MVYSNFAELNAAVYMLVEKNKHTEALGFLNKGIKALPDIEIENNKFMTAWLKAMLYSNIKKYDECLDVIRNIIREGYAFPMSFKRFEPLKELKGYQEVYNNNCELLEKENASASMQYEVYVPKHYETGKTYPLFLALHGHGICNIKEFSAEWKPDVFVNKGFVFAYLQSSQVLCHEGYGWMDDYDKSNKDIKDCIEKIASEYPIDMSSILIGGYSGGAIASVNFVMSNIITIKGLIALCPEIKPGAFTSENVRKAVQSGVKCVFMEGENELPIPDEDEMMKTFDEEGMPYEYYINKGVGHDIPPDIDEKLETAIKFILE